MKTSYLLHWCFGILLSLQPMYSAAEEVKVAVTRAFLETFLQIKPLFEQETGHTLVVISETGVVLYEKIKQGESIDVFLAADTEVPQKLIQEGFAVPESFFVYAMARLVLWTKSANIPQLNQESLFYINRLTLANPATSPYGRASQDVLKKLGVWQNLEPNLVITRTAIESYREILNNRAQAGFILLSQYLSTLENLGTPYWIIPQSFYSPLHLGAVRMRSSENVLGALTLLEFLRCPRAIKIINDFGFKVTNEIDD